MRRNLCFSYAREVGSLRVNSYVPEGPLKGNVGLTNEQHRPTVLEYWMTELIGYLRLLANVWLPYIDVMERQANTMKYKALVSQSVGRGRPLFWCQKSNWSFTFIMFYLERDCTATRSFKNDSV